jgi:CheY-like chemotaxis protein
VVVAEDNLFLRPRIESSLASAGYEPRFVVSAERVARALAADAVAMLVNIDAARLDWERAIRAARETRGDAFPVVGYGPHVDRELFARARSAGCSEVVPNGLVAKNAAGVIGVHVARQG